GSSDLERISDEQANDMCAVLGVFEHGPITRRGRHRLVLATHVDDLRVGRHQVRVFGCLNHDDIGFGQQFCSTHRQQPCVAGTCSDEANVSGSWLHLAYLLLGIGLFRIARLLSICLLCIRRVFGGCFACCGGGCHVGFFLLLPGCHEAAATISAAPSASISAARRSPVRSARCTGPVADSRMMGEPVVAHTTARSHSSSPSSPAATSARAPTGALQPASSVASRRCAAVTAARVCGSSSWPSWRGMSSSADRHSHARAPCPGAGSICNGSRSSVASSPRSRRNRPARASTIASTSPPVTLPIRVSTFP